MSSQRNGVVVSLTKEFKEFKELKEFNDHTKLTYTNANTAIIRLKEKKIKVFALEITDHKRLYTSLNREEFPVAFVLGNELTGLDNDIINLCDDAMEIPMYGVKHSLNVSVAAGLILFEAVRRWYEINKLIK